MNRQELLKRRRELVEMTDRLRKLGDYGAGAADTRELAEALLQLVDHLLEGMRS
jgi:hypothetical protein